MAATLRDKWRGRQLWRSRVILVWAVIQPSNHSGNCPCTPNTSIWASTVLTGFRLQEPFVKKRFPCLSSYDAIYSQILVLLVVLDRRSRGRAKLAILDQDWKAPRWLSMSWRCLITVGPLSGLDPTFNTGRLRVTWTSVMSLLPFSRVATGEAVFYEDSPVPLWCN